MPDNNIFVDSNSYSDINQAMHAVNGSEITENVICRTTNGQVLAAAQVDNKDTLLVQDHGADGFSTYWRGLQDKLPNGASEDSKQQLKENIDSLINSSQKRHTINPIHRPMFAYTWRLVNHISHIPDNKKQEIFDFAYQALCQIIDEDLAKFLSKKPSMKDWVLGRGPNTIKGINHFLDKNRVKYAVAVEVMVANKLKLEGHKFKTETEITDALQNKTALNHDVIENNQVLGFIQRTHGVEDSSHSYETRPAAITTVEKYVQEEDSLRLIQRHHRSPSLRPAIMNSSAKSFGGEPLVENQEFSVEDQAKEFISGVKQRRAKVGGDESKPIVYNLLTSISTDNDQDKTALANLQAMHAYNQTAVTDKNSPFYYVMNVPVNQTTETLRYTSAHPAAREAALFADIAILETLPKEMFSEKGVEHLELIKYRYQTFLRKKNAGKIDEDALFVDSSDFLGRDENGQSARSVIFSLKQQLGWELRGEVDFDNFTTPVENLFKREHSLIQNALGSSDQASSENAEAARADKLRAAFLKLYVSGFDTIISHQKQYGLTIQGMFLALNDYDNLKGCKSGVDRYSYVEGVDNLFLSYIIKEPKDGDSDSEMVRELESIISAYTTKDGDAAAFVKATHRVNGDYKAYGPEYTAAYNDANDAKNITARFGNSDLGAYTYDTNNFVPRANENNQQGNAKKLQAEKAMAKRVVKIVNIADAQEGKLRDADSVQEFRQRCIDTLNTYSSAWGMRSHRKSANDTVEKLENLGEDGFSLESVTDLLEALERTAIQEGSRGFIYNSKYNVKGDLNKSLSSLFSDAGSVQNSEENNSPNKP